MYHITEYAKNADCIFVSGRNIKIHSIYKNTVNFITNNLIFSFQNENSIKTPVSFILFKHGVEELGFYVGEELYIRDKIFYNERIMISAANARLWEPGVHKTSRGFEELLLQKEIAWEVIKKGEKPRLNPLEKAQYDALIKHIDKIRLAFERNEFIKMAQISSDLIGLGTGLTPSGDDFNVGFLSALYHNLNVPVASEILQCYKAELLKKLKETNDISATFLKYACEGKFSEVIHGFYDEGGRKIKQIAAQSILKLGHSSGRDLLIGIYVALELLVNCVQGGNCISYGYL